jgi:hypothetical protein
VLTCEVVPWWARSASKVCPLKRTDSLTSLEMTARIVTFFDFNLISKGNYNKMASVTSTHIKKVN